MKICTCNNCGKIWHDTNPGCDSVEYEDHGLDPLELMEFDSDEPEIPDLFHGCPTCKTDAGLVDNINLGAMTEDQQKFVLTFKPVE